MNHSLHFVALFSPVIIPLVIALLLFFSVPRSGAKSFLAGLMFLLAYVFFCNFFYFSGIFNVYAWLHSVHIFSVLAIYPSVFIYVSLLTNRNLSIRPCLVHYAPAAFFGILSAILFFFFLGQNERIFYLSSYRLNHHFENPFMKLIYFVRVLNVITLFLQIPIYFYLTRKLILEHRKKLESQYSETEGLRLRWVRSFNAAFLLAAFASIFFYAINPIKLFGNDFYLMLPLYAFAVIMCLFGILGNNQQPVFLPDIEEELYAEPENSSELTQRIQDALEQEKIYLQKELKLTDMAQFLNTNRTYLSQEINRSFGLSFCQLINNYRFEEARKLLHLPEHNQTPMEVIAELSGFGSLSSMTRMFRKEGDLPSNYRKNKSL